MLNPVRKLIFNIFARDHATPFLDAVRALAALCAHCRLNAPLDLHRRATGIPRQLCA